jgi:hypothetical protein
MRACSAVAADRSAALSESSHWLHMRGSRGLLGVLASSVRGVQRGVESSGTAVVLQVASFCQSKTRISTAEMRLLQQKLSALNIRSRGAGVCCASVVDTRACCCPASVVDASSSTVDVDCVACVFTGDGAAATLPRKVPTMRPSTSSGSLPPVTKTTSARTYVARRAVWYRGALMP